MINKDLVNGCLELGGSLFTFYNCRVLMRDKQIKGISSLGTYYFAAWGLWNCFWYPSLGQPLSFLGGIAIASANVSYVALLIWFYLNESKSKAGQ